MKKKIRPLSPHLTIYKPQLTSVFSIFHRISGSFLSLTFILSTVFLYFNLFFQNFFYFYAFMVNMVTFCYIIISSVIFFFFFLFCFHVVNGFRHMTWDLGIGLEVKNLTATSGFIFIFSIFVTMIIIYV
jgi:succinate dehydrogenase / fumarate reductase cytochrome b subunit